MFLKKYLVLALCSSMAAGISAQTVFPTGASFDPTAHNKVPKTAAQLTRSYKTPPKASLKAYCPVPRNQAPYNTCVGWATAYCAFSIVNNIAVHQETHRIPEQKETMAFSPSYVYNQISGADDCMSPAFVHEALELLLDQGCARMNEFPFNCETRVDEDMRMKAAPFSMLISGYKALVPYPELNISLTDLVKKSLSEGNPVVGVVKCYDSFMKIGINGIWNGVEDKYYGYHALAIVGYDDDVQGGSFELMNSWGTGWANGGFAWVTYKDFERICAGSYEMMKSMIPLPEATGTTATETPTEEFHVPVSGRLRFVKDSGEEMEANFTKYDHTYRLTRAWRSGTRFRVYASNAEPAFVYILGANEHGQIDQLFPHKEGISAALTYKENEIALPGENTYIKFDQNAGKDYLCVLYSKRPLKIDEIRKTIEAEKKGSLNERVHKALGDRYLAAEHIKFNQNQISFQAKGKAESVVVLIVEAEHLP